MSEFKTNKISPRSGTTQTIGDSGDSVSTSGGSIITNAGSISTAGITGGTINNTTGSLYLRGEVDWKPGDIKTTSFTATDNQGFFVNTTSGEITITLPASPSAGDVVGIKDYANTFDTNKCILNPNGNKIQGSTTNFQITVEGSSIIIIYVDSTRGWVITDASKSADISEGPSFITATGGTITTCGNFKVHTFTGPGTFTVSSLANGPTHPQGGPNNVDYLVVAAGGGGGAGGSGGGGGGFRESHSTPISGSYTASPLATPTGITVTATAFPITVGAGGTGGPSQNGTSGANSVFSTITSAGGAGGRGTNSGAGAGSNGGSGSGGVWSTGSPIPGNRGAGGSGNTPPVSPPQGNNGGTGFDGIASTNNSGGGGGAGGVGGNACAGTGGDGGAGVTTSISGSAVGRSGGGGGTTCRNWQPPFDGVQGTANPVGGGGNGSRPGGASPNGDPGEPTAGTTNTGGGGGGGAYGSGAGSSGGSGVVIIRYKFQ
jgi:hypothetical protein